MPAGHNTRTTSACVRAPRPNARSAGAIAGDVLVSSSRCHKLPARISTFEPMPLRLLARPVRLTRTDAFLLPP